MATTLVPLVEGNPIPLQKELLLVGRQGVCDLLLEHSTVSRSHCILLQLPGKLVVRDLESTNGCRVNGQRVREAEVVDGDILSIGKLKYRIEIRSGSQSASEPYNPHRADGEKGSLLSRADSSVESVAPFSVPLEAIADSPSAEVDQPSALSDSSVPSA